MQLGKNIFIIYCYSCCLEGKSGKTIEKAINNWNRRIEPKEIEIEIK
jgi:hypothetical protein